MKPLNSIKASALLVPIFILLLASCTSSNNGQCAKCADQQSVGLDVNFKIVDKNTRSDLFFGNAAKFKVSELKVRRIVNGVPDTATIKIDNSMQYFNLKIRYQKDVDTVLLQVGDSKQDTLYLLTNPLSNQCCPQLVISNAMLNNDIIYKYDPKKLVISIPHN